MFVLQYDFAYNFIEERGKINHHFKRYIFGVGIVNSYIKTPTFNRHNTINYCPF